jgi:hypothetical protein
MLSRRGPLGGAAGSSVTRCLIIARSNPRNTQETSTICTRIYTCGITAARSAVARFFLNAVTVRPAVATEVTASAYH